MLKDRLFFISCKIIAAAILAGIALLVVILASGRDLPFISKEEQDYSSYRTDSEPDSDVSQPEAVSEEVSQSSTSEPSAEPSSYDRAVSSFEKIHPQTPSYDIYDPALHSLKLVDTSSYQGMDGGSVTLTMGYIITEKNGETHIYSPDGRDITATVGDRTLTVLRDKEGRPLFISDSGEYYYLDDAGALVISDYDSKLDKRAFDCEYPRYLGVQNDTIFRYRDGNMYGYKTKGYVVITAMFREVFAFSDEGVGCVLWKHTGGENLIFYNSKAVTINMEYLPSADRSANALGYYYFDDGLIRVRRQNADKTYSEIIITSDAKPVRTLRLHVKPPRMGDASRIHLCKAILRRTCRCLRLLRQIRRDRPQRRHRRTVRVRLYFGLLRRRASCVRKGTRLDRFRKNCRQPLICT